MLIMVAKPALAISILIMELVMPIPMLAIYIFKFICFENNNLASWQKITFINHVVFVGISRRLELLTQFNNKQFYIVEILCRNKYFEIHSIRNGVPLVIKSKNKRLYSTLNKLHLPYSFKYEHNKFQYKAKYNRTTR